jgi:hypothetical protein
MNIPDSQTIDSMIMIEYASQPEVPITTPVVEEQPQPHLQNEIVDLSTTLPGVNVATMAEAYAKACSTDPLTAKEKRQIAYKKYYEKKKSELLANKKESYNKEQKRAYYLKNRDSINERMKARYRKNKEALTLAKFQAIKERAPSDEFRNYIESLMKEENIKKMSNRQLDFLNSL